MTKRRHFLLAGLAATATGFAGGARSRASHTVVIQQFAFVPEALQVSVGDTVVWVNEDIVPHTATAADGGWDSGRLNRGESWSLEITAAGQIGYSCLFHPAMRATVTAT